MNSAIIVFSSAVAGPISLVLEVGGEPADVRRALRGACSQRRYIVLNRPQVFLANLIRHLSRRSIDALAVVPGIRDPDQRTDYIYTLSVVNRTPDLLIEQQNSPGKWGSFYSGPLFAFLGSEKAAIRTPNVRGRRPKELLRAQIARSNELAANPKTEFTPEQRSLRNAIFTARDQEGYRPPDPPAGYDKKRYGKQRRRLSVDFSLPDQQEPSEEDEALESFARGEAED